MGIKRVLWGSLFALILCVAPPGWADTISGTGTDTFQIWTKQNLKNNGKPYWDNRSLDGTSKIQKKTGNIGFYLTDSTEDPAYTLEDAPDNPLPLPYWGKSIKKSKKKTGGNADLNFVFDRTELTNTAVLALEATPPALADHEEFGWYDVSDPLLTLHPILDGSDSPGTNVTFAPSLQYGFYLKIEGQSPFFTQSRLNPYRDTSHQQFVVFEQSLAASNEVYWIGIENSSRLGLRGKEGGLGDYNDMLIRIGTPSSPPIVPEPSTVMLVLSSTILMIAVRYRRR